MIDYAEMVMAAYSPMEKAMGKRANVISEIQNDSFEKRLGEIKGGYKIVYDFTEEGEGMKKEILIRKYKDKSVLMIDGKEVLTEPTTEKCAKKAWQRGYINYYTYINVAYGEEEVLREKIRRTASDIEWDLVRLEGK